VRPKTREIAVGITDESKSNFTHVSITVIFAAAQKQALPIMIPGESSELAYKHKQRHKKNLFNVALLGPLIPFIFQSWRLHQ